VAELAVALDKPGAHVLVLTMLLDGMGEGTGRTCCACADLEEFARHMREIFRWRRRV